MKSVTVEFSAEQVFLEVYDKENNLAAVKSGLAVPGLKLKVDGNEFSISNLSTESDLENVKNSVDKKDIDIVELAQQYNAETICRNPIKGMYTLVIHSEDHCFDPSKAALIIRKINYAYHPQAGEYYPVRSAQIVVGFAYGNDVYDISLDHNPKYPGEEVRWVGCTE